MGPNGDLFFRNGENTWVKITATADDTLSFQGTTGEAVTLVNTKYQTSYAVKTGTYTLTASDDVIGADSSGGEFTLTLPVASTVSKREFRIYDSGGEAGTAGKNITIESAGSDKINVDDTQVIINADHDHVVLFSDGTHWTAHS